MAKRYWMTLVERDGTPAVQPEFPTHPLPDLLATRRTFLKAAGFSFAGLVASNCRPAPQHAVPHVVQPELTPGRGYAYASTCRACEARCGLLVTTRDGRPTKIEGNPEHPLSGGAVCAIGQASVLGLYDSHRLAHPLKDRARASWGDVDAEIVAKLAAARANGGAVRLLTGTVNSPAIAAAIDRFVASFPNARHCQYDPIPASAILDAYEVTHGTPLLPRYRFDRADAIVSLDADFLGTWISPVEFARSYADRRRVSDERVPAGVHVQIESRLSLTGSKADLRLCLAPDDIGRTALHLAARIAQLSEAPVDWSLGAAPIDAAALDAVAGHLWSARGRALVVAGSDDTRTQIVCNFINELLGSYGSTIDLDRPSHQRRGRERDLEALRGELARGEVAVLIVAGVNPVFDLPERQALKTDLARVPLLVSVAEQLDETASLAHIVCPDHHYLESWGDAEPVAGVVSLAQPTIQPMGDTRAFIETLAVWTGTPVPAYDLIRQHWEHAFYPRAGTTGSFAAFWNHALERGVVEVAPEPPAKRPFDRGAVQSAALAATVPQGGSARREGLAIVLYPKVGMGDGRHAHNPWLHELPDPITKVTWDNYACLSPATAQRLNVSDGDVVRLSSSGAAIELPAFVQPGQHDGVVAVALGYGRAGTDRFSGIGPSWIGARRTQGPVGVNASVFVLMEGGARHLDGRRAEIARTGRIHRLASTQLHHSLTVPGAAASAQPALAIVQETTARELSEGHEGHEEHAELWPRDHAYEGHRWGMAIDLDACTGCSACVIACQAENNIPVVGYDEVSRHREMHWLRIDRYYAGGDADVSVAHQPMLCQHCEHAPCEVVCPVLATVHSSEGLNEQVYNRCVGTRYCANNCPYKVRRFNWFDYPRADSRQHLVLNPNVTVRSRGVMEKCTFCVQRIEEARNEARQDGRPMSDGAVQTACQQTCPSHAIVFGNLNDPQSRVARLSKSHRAYRVLEELNARPSVRYLQIVRRDTVETASD